MHWKKKVKCTGFEILLYLSANIAGTVAPLPEKVFGCFTDERTSVAFSAWAQCCYHYFDSNGHLQDAHVWRDAGVSSSVDPTLAPGHNKRNRCGLRAELGHPPHSRTQLGVSYPSCTLWARPTPKPHKINGSCSRRVLSTTWIDVFLLLLASGLKG